jgi:hypothetical protein
MPALMNTCVLGDPPHRGVVACVGMHVNSWSMCVWGANSAAAGHQDPCVHEHLHAHGWVLVEGERPWE